MVSPFEICKRKTVFLHKSSLKHLGNPEENANPTKVYLSKQYFSNLLKTTLSIAMESRKIDFLDLE
jgi:N utilization substance protein B